MNCYANPLSAFVINDKNEFDIKAYGGSADNIISDSITGGKIDGNGIITPDENSLKVTYKYKYNDKGDTITCSVGFVIAVNETNFPDENFRNYILYNLTDSNGNKVGGDGILTADEIAAVKEINVKYKNISSLKGIEYFTKLKELECYNNKLTKLDLSNNTELEELYCDTNSLTALDLSSCDKLLRLDFTDNQVSELKLSENLSKLNQLICANNKLTELDLSNIEFVYINNGSSNMETKLKCSNNEITNIKLKDDAKISSFYADNNPLLAINGGSSEDFCFADDYSFRVSPLKDFITENKTITLADYGINPEQVSNLSNAEISDDKTKLEITDFPATYDYGFADGKTISCTINYGIPVDKEHFPDDNFRNWILKRDYGTDGVLTAEEIKSVDEIDVADEKISDLQGIEYFTALERLNCSTNQLTSLDLSKNTKLYWIDCDENQLTSINLNGCTELTEIYCSSNKLTLLDVSANLKLEALGCGNNELQSLDVSKNPNIKELGCDKNKLESLNISANPNLTGLDCSDNKLKSLDVSKNTELSVLYFASNNVEKIDLSGCTELKELDCRRNQLESLDVSKNVLLKLLYCGSNPISSLDVSQNTDLVELNCDENSLTEIDVSKNTKLEKLSCYYNKLTSLNVSENAALKTLNCRNNQLTSLDVSKSTNLTRLYCSDNQLTLLDLSKNTALTELECSDNQLTSLDLSKNINLTRLDCSYNPLTSLDLSATAVTDLSANTELKEYAYKTVFDGGKLDLTTLDGFDVSKADSWDNATIEGNIISIIDPTEPVAYFMIQEEKKMHGL